MGTQFSKDMNIITNFFKDMDIIAALDDQPNDVGGLTAAELKAKFDEGGKAIQEYINNTLIPEVLGLDATETQRIQNEADRATAESARNAAEELRLAAETARADAENNRLANESKRETAERQRVEAEQQRQLAEQYRADETAGIVSQATKQAQLAEAAQDSASSSAASAENASVVAAEKAEAVVSSAAEAAASVLDARSWAVGGTGTRPGEDEDNAKYWAGLAHAASGGGVITFHGRSGAVVPQPGDYTAEMVGAVALTKPAANGNLPVLNDDGQLEDSQKSISDFAPAPLMQNLALYINADTGNDEHDGFTPDTAKRTLAAALKKVPQNLGSRNVELWVCGTFDEAISLNSYHGGTLEVKVMSDQSASFSKGVCINSCACNVTLMGLQLCGNMYGDVVNLSNCTNAVINGCEIDASQALQNVGIRVQYGTYCSVLFGNIHHAAKACACESGILSVRGLGGSDNITGLVAGSVNSGRAGLILASTVTLQSDIAFAKEAGGILFVEGELQ